MIPTTRWMTNPPILHVSPRAMENLAPQQSQIPHHHRRNHVRALFRWILGRDHLHSSGCVRVIVSVLLVFGCHSYSAMIKFVKWENNDAVLMTPAIFVDLARVLISEQLIACWTRMLTRKSDNATKNKNELSEHTKIQTTHPYPTISFSHATNSQQNNFFTVCSNGRGLHCFDTCRHGTTNNCLRA